MDCRYRRSSSYRINEIGKTIQIHRSSCEWFHRSEFSVHRRFLFVRLSCRRMAQDYTQRVPAIGTILLMVVVPFGKWFSSMDLLQSPHLCFSSSSWENKHMYAIVSVFGLSIWEREIFRNFFLVHLCLFDVSKWHSTLLFSPLHLQYLSVIKQNQSETMRRLFFFIAICAVFCASLLRIDTEKKISDENKTTTTTMMMLIFFFLFSSLINFLYSPIVLLENSSNYVWTFCLWLSSWCCASFIDLYEFSNSTANDTWFHRFDAPITIFSTELEHCSNIYLVDQSEKRI